MDQPFKLTQIMREGRFTWGLRPQAPFYPYDLADLGFILDLSKK